MVLAGIPVYWESIFVLSIISVFFLVTRKFLILWLNSDEILIAIRSGDWNSIESPLIVDSSWKEIKISKVVETQKIHIIPVHINLYIS